MENLFHAVAGQFMVQAFGEVCLTKYLQKHSENNQKSNNTFMKKLFFATILGLLVALGTFAQSGTTGPLTWSLSNGTLTISGNGAMPDYVYPLNPPWGGNISEVIIKDGVTSIGANAFKEKNLSSIIVGNSVKRIGWQAFYGCEELTSITIPNSVTSIDLEAFRYCSGLTSITIIDNGAISIGTQAFQGCGKLASVNFGNGVKSIEGYAFMNCSSLTSVTIPNSVTKIGSSAFANCIGLTSVTIGNGVTDIGFSVFAQCLNLASVTIGSGVKTIANEAFYNCPLAKLTINAVTPPDFILDPFRGVDYRTCILEVPAGSKGAYQAKTGWSSFKSIYEIGSKVIPDGITGNLTWAFANGKLTISGNGVMPNYINTPVPWDLYRTCITAVEIKQGVSSIGDYAFYRCDNLDSINIGNSVSNIGYYAFLGCRSLTSVTVPNSVINIGNSAFGRCSNLASIIIPNSVTRIENSAFQYCSSLVSVTIGNGVTSIGEQSFWGCTALGKLTVKAVTPPSVRSTYTFYEVNKQTCILEVPAGSKTKYQNAEYWKDFQKINEISAVTGATGVLNWSLAEGTLTISGSGVIPDYSSPDFAPWYSYRNSITAVEIPEGVTSIGNYAFYGCSNLTSVTIPNSLKSANEQALDGQGSFNSVAISNSVTSIGNYAFSGCSSLTSVIIPNSVTSIGEQAFSGCSSLLEVTCLNATPPQAANNAFANINNSCILYVPTGSLAAYSAATGWKEFYTIREKELSTAMPTNYAQKLKVYFDGNSLIIDGANEGENVQVFDLTGKLLYSTKLHESKISLPLQDAGLYLVRTKSGTTKVVVK